MAEADPAIHAAAIRSRGDWIHGLIDPAANGRDRHDGYRLIQVFRKLGLHLESVNNPLESGILQVGQRVASGRLKVLPLLVKYLEERRLYRRDEYGHIVIGRDHLQDATRCLVSGISLMRPRPKATSANPSPASLGKRSWMAS